jgi:hypothetical protein
MLPDRRVGPVVCRDPVMIGNRPMLLISSGLVLA